jgi:hypothetical protein
LAGGQRLGNRGPCQPAGKSFTGHDLSNGPAVMRSIAFTSGDFWTWVVLAVLALVAIEIARYQRRNQLTEAVHRHIFAVFEGTKAVLLLYVVVRCIWKGFGLANKSAISLVAQKALYGSAAPANAQLLLWPADPADRTHPRRPRHHVRQQAAQAAEDKAPARRHHRHRQVRPRRLEPVRHRRDLPRDHLRPVPRLAL